MFSCVFFIFFYSVVSGEWPMLLEHRARVPGAQRFVSECLHVVFLFSYFIAYSKFLLLIQLVYGEWPMLFEHRARVPGAQRFCFRMPSCGFSVKLFHYLFKIFTSYSVCLWGMANDF